MSADRISHVSASAPVCANIKSRKEPKKRCTNLAIHGEFCGIHYKHPRPWCPCSPAATRAHKPFVDPELELRKLASVRKIAKWWRLYNGLYQTRRRGLAYWNRSICTNDSDFFSTESLNDISGCSFYSYKDSDNHIYGFDIRSIHTLIYRARIAGESALNPFTRTPFTDFVKKQVMSLVRALHYHHIPTEWAPLNPPTPEQQTRMKVVDIFSKIDELNYYSSPDWFLDLTIEGHRRFYNALFDIWTFRANLSNAQKSTIVPGYATRLFRTPRWALADINYEGLQRINLGVIRLMISSATDRNDRILGAMYVISALTLACDTARTAYPWLYESVVEAPPALREERRPALANLLGIGWLHDLLALRDAIEAPEHGRGGDIPLLELPPPANNGADEGNS